MPDLAEELLDRYVESEIQLRERLLVSGARVGVGLKERERRDRLRAEVLKHLRS